MLRSTVEVSELLQETTAILGSAGLRGEVPRSFRDYIGSVIATKEAARTFIERQGFGFFPQTNVGTNAPIQTERVRKRSLTPKRYAASIVIDSTFLKNDPAGYANKLGMYLNRAGDITMHYLAELHMLKLWSTELSIADGLSIFNASHVVSDGVQSNTTASALSAAILMTGLNALTMQFNTEGAPVLAEDSQKCDLLCSAAKYAETVSIVKSSLVPGGNNNDDFEWVGAHIRKVIPMRYWPLVASTSNKFILVPANKGDIQTSPVQTLPMTTTHIAKNRRGLEYLMAEFEIDFITKTHYGYYGGG